MDCYYNLTLADQIAGGRLPPEPFFRSPTYSALLALFLKSGITAARLPDLARLLNFISLLGLCWVVGRWSWEVWGKTSSMLLSLLLVGLHPVVWFFAGDPYDILLTTAFFAGFGWWGWRLWNQTSWTWPPVLAAGLLLGAGCALRSQLLPLAVLWPMAMGWRVWTRQKNRPAALGLASLAAVGPALYFLALGTAHYRMCGTFLITPWQGPYMIYYGNHPDLFSGYIYKQYYSVDSVDDTIFPVEAEARAHYTARTGRPATDIAEMNRFYSSEFRRILREDFARWKWIPLRKLYALLNNQEQYDNKTWDLQKSLSPWLRWNPLNWGILLVVGGLGWLLLWRRDPTLAWWLAGLGGLYLSVSFLTIVNNRYRLPLYPLLAVAAGGVGAWPELMKKAGKIWRWATLSAALLLAVVTFSNWAGIRGEDTREADFVLMAQAANRAGEDEETLRWVEEGQRLNPRRPDLWELRFLAEYNLFLAERWDPTAEELRIRTDQLAHLLETNLLAQTGHLRFLQGLWQWKSGQGASAWQTWQELLFDAQASPASARGDALAALIFTGGMEQSAALTAWRKCPTTLLLQSVAAGLEWEHREAVPVLPRSLLERLFAVK